MQQSGLPGGISDNFRVVFMDPLGVLHKLQALVLLVDETMFFPIELSVLALRRQKAELDKFSKVRNIMIKFLIHWL